MSNRDLDTGQVAFGKRPALIVVDMTRGFTRFDSPLGGAEDAVIEANQQLLAAFRQADLPICFTSVVYKNDSEASVFRAHLPALNILQHGSHWIEVDERLQRQTHEPVFNKLGPSGFFNTGLHDWLQAQNADCVVITGLTTSGCVRATVIDALQYNYPIWVAKEACGDRNQDAHHANLHDMAAKYAAVRNVLDICDAILT